MKSVSGFLLSLFVATASGAAALPGFRVEAVGTTRGFASSLAIDSRGTIYYTTTSGDVVRFDGGANTVVAHVPTESLGDSGLLGMALKDDRTAVVHYVTPKQTADVVSLVDLTTGRETLLHTFVGDITLPGRSAPPEHHGGNPTVAPDGSVFVAIGDYGQYGIAAKPEWNAGKVWRIAPDGTATQFARGFRNPFDLAWDAVRRRVILTDNGPILNDELDIVHEGEFHGWPATAGEEPPIEGAVPPAYVFQGVVAPTGIVALSGRNALLQRGYVIGGFVTKALYYVPDIDARPLPAPITLVSGESGFTIDVAEAPNGDVYFISPNAIYRLIVPARGDCNGDGVVDAADAAALAQELFDGAPEPATSAPAGRFRGTWGCDVNADGMVDARDTAALGTLLGGRTRAVGRR